MVFLLFLFSVFRSYPKTVLLFPVICLIQSVICLLGFCLFRSNFASYNFVQLQKIKVITGSAHRVDTSVHLADIADKVLSQNAY